MIVTCPHCGAGGEVDFEVAIGQHIICPACLKKYSYGEPLEPSAPAPEEPAPAPEPPAPKKPSVPILVVVGIALAIIATIVVLSLSVKSEDDSDPDESVPKILPVQPSAEIGESAAEGADEVVPSDEPQTARLAVNEAEELIRSIINRGFSSSAAEVAENSRPDLQPESFDWLYTLTPTGAVITGVRQNYGVLVLPDRLEDQPVIAIADEAFAYSDRITRIELPKSLMSLGEGAFRACAKLESLVLPDALTALPRRLCLGCGELKSVNLPAGLISIGEEAFRSCGKLEKLALPDALRTIEPSAFEECTALVEVGFGKNLETVGDSAFGGCSALESIEIPDGVNSIGVSAFGGCRNLRKITVPKRAKLGNWAFEGCPSRPALRGVTVSQPR